MEWCGQGKIRGDKYGMDAINAKRARRGKSRGKKDTVRKEGIPLAHRLFPFPR